MLQIIKLIVGDIFLLPFSLANIVKGQHSLDHNSVQDWVEREEVMGFYRDSLVVRRRMYAMTLEEFVFLLTVVGRIAVIYPPSSSYTYLGFFSKSGGTVSK